MLQLACRDTGIETMIQRTIKIRTVYDIGKPQTAAIYAYANFF